MPGGSETRRGELTCPTTKIVSARGTKIVSPSRSATLFAGRPLWSASTSTEMTSASAFVASSGRVGPACPVPPSSITSPGRGRSLLLDDEGFVGGCSRRGAGARQRLDERHAPGEGVCTRAADLSYDEDPLTAVVFDRDRDLGLLEVAVGQEAGELGLELADGLGPGANSPHQGEGERPVGLDRVGASEIGLVPDVDRQNILRPDDVVSGLGKAPSVFLDTD